MLGPRRAQKVLCGSALLVAASGWLWLYAALVWLRPYDTQELTSQRQASWRLLAQDGRALREVASKDGSRAEWRALDALSPWVAAATVAAEDQRFWRHGGVDAWALTRIVYQFATTGRIASGGSTLTMQLARLLAGLPSRSFWAKGQQVLDAWRLERALGKREILEHYLNRAPYGAGTTGIEAASRRYFGRPSELLSVAQAALLAGLPKAPTELCPWTHLEAAKTRQRYVLGRMRALGMLTAEEHALALAEPLALAPRQTDLLAVHFTDFVMRSRPLPGEVATTLDADLQAVLERMVQAHVQALAPGGLTNAAVVVLENATCAIRAMVGSRDYWAEASGAVNGALAKRQPGSTLKPFTYALAFERGFSPASVLSDIPTRYPGADGTQFSPRNYTERFIGPVLAADALGRSLNVPAIRLANAVGVAELLAHLRAVGFASLDQSAEHYGLGLTLGNGEVSLQELAQGYAMLARGGQSCRAHALQNDASPGERVLSAEVAYLVTDILQDERLRLRAFGANNPLMFGFPLAVKTGTSSNWRDSWAVGYSQTHTIAVWSGDFGGTPMSELSGVIGAGPLFHEIAAWVVRRGAIDRTPSAPAMPPGVVEVTVCALSGMAPGPDCPNRRSVRVLAKSQKDEAQSNPCDWHRRLRVDKRNGLLASPRCPRRFVTEKVFEQLPPRFAEWQARFGQAVHAPPARSSPLCPENGVAADAVVITSPRPRDVYLIEPGYDPRTQSLALTAEVSPPTSSVVWLVDGVRFASTGWPYAANWPLAPGRHRVVAQAGHRQSDAVEFEVR